MLSLPTNINMLAPQRYKLDLPGCPNFCAMIQKVAHPQIVGQKLKNSGTPFANMNLAGNPLLFGDLNVTVKLDEDLFALSEIMDWMFAYGAPTSTEQFSTLTKDLTFGNNQTEYRDAILNIFDASGNPTFSINYLNLFPIAISGFELDTTIQDIPYITVTVTFAIQSFQYKRIGEKISNVSEINS